MPAFNAAEKSFDGKGSERIDAEPGLLFWGDKVAIQPETRGVSLCEKARKMLLLGHVAVSVILLNADSTLYVDDVSIGPEL